MTFEKIREAVTKRPFRAFTLHLNDGHSAVLDHLELIILPPDTEDVVVVYEVPGGVRRNGKGKPRRKRS